MKSVTLQHGYHRVKHEAGSAQGELYDGLKGQDIDRQLEPQERAEALASQRTPSFNGCGDSKYSSGDSCSDVTAPVADVYDPAGHGVQAAAPAERKRRARRTTAVSAHEQTSLEHARSEKVKKCEFDCNQNHS